jgi:glycosyltransferase involved in cell wall biosynthesis
MENCLERSRVIRIGPYRGHGVISKYLAETVGEFLDIGFVFPGRYVDQDLVHCDEFNHGKLVSSISLGRRIHGFSLAIQRIHPELLNLIIGLVMLRFVLQRRRKYHVLVMNSMSPGALLAKAIKIADLSLLVSDDIYYPEGNIVNRIIRSFLIITEKHLHNNLEEVWYVSPRLLGFKRRQGIVKENAVRRKVVPHGVDLTWSSWKESQKVERTTIAYFGAIVPGRGLELLLDSLDNVRRIVPQVRLRIVGQEIPRYGESLRDRIHRLDLNSNVQFISQGAQDEDDIKSIATCAVGAAIYDRDQISILYTDSSKIKKYIGCGLPIVVSKHLPYSEELVKAGVGIAVSNDKASVTKALIDILTDDELWRRMTAATIRYGKTFDYREVYGHAFMSLCGSQA